MKSSPRQTLVKKRLLSTGSADFGFLLGMFTLFAAFGTLDFTSIFDAAEAGNFQQVFGASTLVIATLLLFVGAIGNPRKFPLYVWLPDAMEGPNACQCIDSRRDDGNSRRVYDSTLRCAL